MSAENAEKYQPVKAFPVKSFFVHMLTRDILLEDAILDLLDNCVDGILRANNQRKEQQKKSAKANLPYNGFWAEIKFDKTSFSIADNCGGIPWSLHEYAFRMGRDPERPADVTGTVGIYGVGMKRAIFKLGTSCLIATRNARDAYEVDVPKGWMDDETDWLFPAKQAKKPMDHEGTTIVVGALHKAISERFSIDAADFKRKLATMVATHYSAILNKGFKVSINGDNVRPNPTKILFSPPGKKGSPHDLRPFVFKTTTSDNVEIFVTVGFTRPIPTPDQVESEQEAKRNSTEDAGWTIICNDRAVVYCDRTELTGWGEANVPRYHTQFIAISGIVEFKGPAEKLPTTTTKRYVDASSSLYLQVKNKMREGMRIFTDYTNKWKSRPDESKKYIEHATLMSLEEIKFESTKLKFTPTSTSVPPGEQYKPQLPLPKKLERHKRRISYVKTVDQIRAVSEHIFSEPDVDASAVGEACFDAFLKEAS